MTDDGGDSEYGEGVSWDGRGSSEWVAAGGLTFYEQMRADIEGILADVDFTPLRAKKTGGGTTAQPKRFRLQAIENYATHVDGPTTVRAKREAKKPEQTVPGGKASEPPAVVVTKISVTPRMRPNRQSRTTTDHTIVHVNTPHPLPSKATTAQTVEVKKKEKRKFVRVDSFVLDIENNLFQHDST